GAVKLSSFHGRGVIVWHLPRPNGDVRFRRLAVPEPRRVQELDRRGDLQVHEPILHWIASCALSLVRSGRMSSPCCGRLCTRVSCVSSNLRSGCSGPETPKRWRSWCFAMSPAPPSASTHTAAH